MEALIPFAIFTLALFLFAAFYSIAVKPLEEKTDHLLQEISALRVLVSKLAREQKRIEQHPEFSGDGISYGGELAKAVEELDTFMDEVDPDDSYYAWTQVEALKNSARSQRAETVGTGPQVYRKRVRGVQSTSAMGLGQSRLLD